MSGGKKSAKQPTIAIIRTLFHTTLSATVYVPRLRRELSLRRRLKLCCQCESNAIKTDIKQKSQRMAVHVSAKEKGSLERRFLVFTFYIASGKTKAIFKY